MAVLDFEEWESEKVLDAVLAAGFDSVEWTLAHRDSLRNPASALTCHQDLASHGKPAVEATLKGIDAAAAAGIGVVNVLTGPNLWENGARDFKADESTWTSVLTGLEQICDHGEKAGVTIGFEPCWGTLAHDATTAQRVLDSVPVSLNFDPSHFVMTGDPIPELIRRWQDRLVHFHLKDAFGRPGFEGEDFIFPLLGEGQVPWSETFAALDEVGYSGALSVEFEAYRYYEQILENDPVAATRLAREQVAALLGEEGR